jgi:anti-anti-sigma regulatory factor/HAMP domain-containing protein
MSGFLSPVESQSRWLLAFALVVAGTAIVAARSMSRPISRLTETASQLAKGNLSEKVEVASSGEIGVLEAAFSRMAADIKRLVDDLAARNQELHRTNETLQRQNVLLEEEVAERARKEVILREQQEAIRRLSTPIIAVWDGVVALPVIGVVDEARASQMMDKLLAEIVRLRASVAIFDLTGVERVDAPTAGHLLEIVRAAKLLGSRCVLSGISPPIAVEMVGFDLGERGVISFRTLEDALRYAVELSAEKRVRRRRR